MTAAAITGIFRKASFCLLGTIVPVLAFASVIEKITGSAIVSDCLYASPLFFSLWAATVVAAIVYLIRIRIWHKPHIAVLHLSLILILTGAACTALFAQRGEASFCRRQHTDSSIQIPKEISLSSFEIIFYPGTQSPMDYRASLFDGNRTHSVSLNNTAQIGGYTFCLQRFSGEKENPLVTFSVSHDPIGHSITIISYWLLFASMIWCMSTPSGRWRALCRQARKPAAILAALSLSSFAFAASPSREEAALFDDILIECSGRVMPMASFASSAVTKLHGSQSFDNLTPMQIILDLYINADEWGEKKFVKVADPKLQTILGINGNMASYNDFISDDSNYKLQPYLDEISGKNNSKDYASISRMNEKFLLLKQIMEGSSFRIFPVITPESNTLWASPTQRLPQGISPDESAFIYNSFGLITQLLISSDFNGLKNLTTKIINHQHNRCGKNIPSQSQVKAENFVQSAARYKIFILCLIIGIFAWIAELALTQGKFKRFIKQTANVFVILLFVWLTLIFSIQWYAGNHIPLGNGQETMFFLALATSGIWIVLHRIIQIPASWALIVAGMALAVASIGNSDPQVSQLMPVLNSPLLSIHVMLIMTSYAFLAIIALGAASALCRHQNKDAMARITLYNNIILYPALFLLGAGIFVGAMWADVSWGRYWGWDPKEVWALIMFIIYAFPCHCSSITIFRNPRFLNAYLLISFLSVIITYFGVNFILGGAHSYA